MDEQLRGRAGRQGDPGGSVFFVSMEDELVTSYAPDAVPPRETADDGLVSDAAARRASSAPPRRMSVPRPAMLVEMVTAPGAPAPATI